jgi:hypothetical protein
VPVGEQPVGEVRADEPRPSGDQNAHGRAGGYLSSWNARRKRRRFRDTRVARGAASL